MHMSCWADNQNSSIYLLRWHNRVWLIFILALCGNTITSTAAVILKSLQLWQNQRRLMDFMHYLGFYDQEQRNEALWLQFTHQFIKVFKKAYIFTFSISLRRHFFLNDLYIAIYYINVHKCQQKCLNPSINPLLALTITTNPGLFSPQVFGWIYFGPSHPVENGDSHMPGTTRPIWSVPLRSSSSWRIF